MVALTRQGTLLTDRHRRTQTILGASIISDLLGVYDLLDFARLDVTSGVWLNFVMPVIETGWGRSVLISSNYYDGFRAVEVGETARSVAAVPPRFNYERARASMYTEGVIGVKKRVQVLPPEKARELARVSQARAGMKYVLEGGRDLLDSYMGADRRLLGYARVTGPSPCYFCALLASRGPVYRKETGGFKAHYSCNCVAEPVFGRDEYDWPGKSREFRELYEEATVHSVDLINDFRRAYNEKYGAQ